MVRFCIFLAALMWSISGLKSQTIVITFEGIVNATPTPLDSILVMNLTQEGDTTIYFPANELILGTVGIGDGGQAGGLRLRSLANPFADHTEVLLDAPGGALLLLLSDAMGRELAAYRANMVSGAHRFRVGCAGPGVHMLTAVHGGVRRTLRLMATEGSGQVGLSYMGGGGSMRTKSDRALFSWMPGDELRYIGYATSGEVIYSAAIDEVPVASATRTFVMAAGATCPETPTVTDVDGNTYPAVQIGDQCWMAENLRTGAYRDGTPIPSVPDATAWSQLSSGAWSVHPDAVDEPIYGKLYNWYVAADANTCPQGWHVPSEVEWQQLELELGVPVGALSSTGYRGGVQNVGGQMKITTLWGAPNTGATNESGFAGLPGGFRDGGNGGYVAGLSAQGQWWVATESTAANAWSRLLSFQNAGIFRFENDKRYGQSVRCVRD